MKKEKILEVIDSYEKWFKENEIPKTDGPYDEKLGIGDWGLALSHCHEMLDKMRVFIKEDRMNKVYRWLGFVQGCLWSTKEANRPDKKTE